MTASAEIHDLALEIREDGWRTAVADVEAVTRRAALAALAAGRPTGGPLEAAVVLADDAFVQGLNRAYRHVDAPTNVLSFPGDPGSAPWLPEGEPDPLGDVVIALETTVRESGEQDLPVVDHLTHLTVHGILHLLGYDHDTDERAAEMEGLEIQILAGLGVPDPYRAEPCNGQGI